MAIAEAFMRLSIWVVIVLHRRFELAARAAMTARSSYELTLVGNFSCP